MSLEKEAKKFMTERQKEKKPSIATIRFYAGCALTGLISTSRNVNAEKIVEEAFVWAALMAEEEKKL